MSVQCESLQIATAGGGAELHVRIWPGRENAGRLVCFHEAVATGAEFALLAEVLAEQGIEVVAPDFIGHGRSTWFGDPARYNWMDFVNCVNRIVARYGGPNVHLLGSSYGGTILLFFLLAAKARPASATFVDIPLFKREGSRALPWLNRLARPAFAMLEEAKANFDACRHPLHPEARHLEAYLTRERFLQTEGRFRVRCDPAAIDAFETASGGRGSAYVRDLSKLACRALFLYGRESPNRNPELFADLAAAHPNLSFVDTIEGGHPPPLMSRSQVAPIVDFVIRQGETAAATGAA